MLLEDKVNFNLENFKLVCLSILALDIPLEITKIPHNENELYLTIRLIFNTLENHEELIRRASSLLEQIEQQNYQEGYYGLIKDYLNKFIKLAQSHPFLAIKLDEKNREKIAVKLLANLLFYSAKNGTDYLQKQVKIK